MNKPQNTNKNMKHIPRPKSVKNFNDLNPNFVLSPNFIRNEKSF